MQAEDRAAQAQSRIMEVAKQVEDAASHIEELMRNCEEKQRTIDELRAHLTSDGTAIRLQELIDESSASLRVRTALQAEVAERSRRLCAAEAALTSLRVSEAQREKDHADEVERLSLAAAAATRIRRKQRNGTKSDDGGCGASDGDDDDYDDDDDDDRCDASDEQYAVVLRREASSRAEVKHLRSELDALRSAQSASGAEAAKQLSRLRMRLVTVTMKAQSAKNVAERNVAAKDAQIMALQRRVLASTARTAAAAAVAGKAENVEGDDIDGGDHLLTTSHHRPLSEWVREQIDSHAEELAALTEELF
jgi:hypothetical protein